MAAKREPIPNDREAVLIQVLLPGEQYGLAIRQAYEDATKERLPLGSLYTTLDRMERKGFVTSRPGEAAVDRGGNRRCYFKVTTPGVRALNAYRDRIMTISAMLGASRAVARGGEVRRA